jgi:peptidoglycan-associated lipoprotein
MKRLWFVLLVVVVVSFGCKQRAITQPEAQPQQKETKETEGKAPEEVTEQKAPSEVESVEEKEKAAREMEEKEGMFKDIHFDFDKYDISDADKPGLKSTSSWMVKNPDAKLSIEGHCDERGTNEYNLALGDRRAKSVKDYLVSLGVPSSRIETISYGEEKPLCTEHTEECWAKNRRAHFVVLSKAGKK